MTIRALIFDFGGVLMRTVNPALRRELERRHGLPAGSVDGLVFGHPLWDEAQLGHLSSDEFWAAVGQGLELQPGELTEFRELFWAGDRLDQDLIAVLRDLRAAGYRIALLSNNPAALRQRVEHLCAGLFDEVVISGCEGLLKPDPAIFQMVLARLGLQPAEAVFVDDAQTNVAAACALGMSAVRFRGLAPLRQELRELGLRVPDLAIDALPDVRAVIFDWGGVLERMPDDAHFARWARWLHLSPQALDQALWGGVYERLEVGEITTEEYAQDVAARLGLPDAGEATRFLGQFYGDDWLDETVLQAVKTLRERNYRVALLTNAFPDHRHWVRAQFGLALQDEFDLYINSAEVGMRKPDLAVFRLVLERLGTAPEQTVFVDDSLRHVDGARALGIHALQFVDTAVSLAQLERMLGCVGALTGPTAGQRAPAPVSSL